MLRAATRKRAFFVWCPWLSAGPETGHCGVVFAASAGKARYLTLLSARDSYPNLTFADVAVRRARAFDRMQEEQSGMFLPQYVEVPNGD